MHQLVRSAIRPFRPSTTARSARERRGRWAAAAVTLLATSAVVPLAGPATPAAAAVPGFQIVSVTGAQNSNASKSVTASCPADKRVIGTGFHLLGGQGDIILDQLIPTANTVTVAAREDQDGTLAEWKITALAVCATPPPGLQLVTRSSALGPKSNATVVAACPAGKSLLGTGASLANGLGQVSLPTLLASTRDVAAVGVQDQDGYTGSWSVTAYALCAFPLDGLSIAQNNSTLNSSTQKVVSTSCGAKKSLGAGWTSHANGQVAVNFVGVGGSGVTLVVNEDDDGLTSDWRATIQAICATA